MSDFETVLICLLIPAAYVLIYIAGKYDILNLICKMLEERWNERNITDRLIGRLEKEISENQDACLMNYRAGLYKAIEFVQEEGEMDEP